MGYAFLFWRNKIGNLIKHCLMPFRSILTVKTMKARMRHLMTSVQTKAWRIILILCCWIKTINLNESIYVTARKIPPINTWAWWN